jgi:serine protease
VLVSFLFTLILSLVNGPVDFGGKDALPDLAPDRIVVRLRDGVSDDEIKGLTAQLKGRVACKSPYLDFYTVGIPDGEDIDKILSEYQKAPSVLYADRIAIGRIFWHPNDPYFPYQWHLDSDHLNMEDAWDIERGDSSVAIAVVDCGVAYEDYPIPINEEHPEVQSFDGWYHQATDLGGVRFIPGYDFVNDDAHPNDNNGHGTHVAAIIAEATNNNAGMAGMAPDISIMPVKVLDYTGVGYTTDIADGISYAVSNGADIVNLSLGGEPGDSTGWRMVHDAIKNARQSGVLVVAAAGNKSANQLSYPAAYPECISVAATEWRDSLTYYSQYGPGLDISAPGGDLTHDRNGDGYGDGILQETFRRNGDTCWVDEFLGYFYHGTSMAAPMVSALAGLLKSNGFEDANQIEDIIYSNAKDLGVPGYDTIYGWGRIEPLSALLFNDTIPPVFSILVLQNAYLEKWVDIWVFSSEYLANGDSPPDSVVVSIGTEEEVFLRKIPNTERVYHGEFHLPTIGDMNITVSGVDVGRNRGTNNRTYSFSKITPNGGEVYSPDKYFRCYFPPASLWEDCYILSGRLDEYGRKWLGITSSKQAIGDAYLVSPGLEETKEEITVALQYNLRGENIPEEKIAVFRWNGEGWERLESVIDMDKDIVYARANGLGIFQLFVDDKETDIIPIKNNINLVGPNPFLQRTELMYTIREPGRLDVSVYDLMGREVKRLVNKVVYPGSYNLFWDGVDSRGSRVSSGAYIVHSKGIVNKSIKVILIKR